MATPPDAGIDRRAGREADSSGPDWVLQWDSLLAEPEFDAMVDDIVEAPTDDIGHLTVFALGNAGDPVLDQVPEARRPTLIAEKTGRATYRFDIHLQGPKETVFFDM